MIIKHNPKKQVAPIKEQPKQVLVEEEPMLEPAITDRVEPEIKIVYSEDEGKYKIIEIKKEEEI